MNITYVALCLQEITNHHRQVKLNYASKNSKDLPPLDPVLERCLHFHGDAVAVCPLSQPTFAVVGVIGDAIQLIKDE